MNAVETVVVFPDAPLPKGAKVKKSHHWDRHPEDFYVEPFNCSEQLFAAEKFNGSICDPACGLGRIVVSARKAGYQAYGYDLVRRSEYCIEEIDFINPSMLFVPCDNTVFNPPFKDCQKYKFPEKLKKGEQRPPPPKEWSFKFIRRALEVTNYKTAALLPADWHCAGEVSEFLDTTPLLRVWSLTSRPSMPPGPVIEAGLSPGNGRGNFNWYVWMRGYDGPSPLNFLRRPPKAKGENHG